MLNSRNLVKETYFRRNGWDLFPFTIVTIPFVWEESNGSKQQHRFVLFLVTNLIYFIHIKTSILFLFAQLMSWKIWFCSQLLRFPRFLTNVLGYAECNWNWIKCKQKIERIILLVMRLPKRAWIRRKNWSSNIILGKKRKKTSERKKNNLLLLVIHEHLMGMLMSCAFID